MNLEGKVALVTGGAMGIGFATAKRLLDEGATVILWDLNSEALSSAVKELREFGEVESQVCDVTDKILIEELAQGLITRHGMIDIVVNNAGYVQDGNFLERDELIWEKTMDVNFNSVMYVTKAFLPKMYANNSGHIVNISSASSFIGVPGLAVYAASKWAVWGFTESLRLEAWESGKRGVKFSSIHPGYIATGMFEGAKLGFLGNLIIPLVKDHDVIAKAIVNSALIKGKFCIKRPRTLNLTIRLRGLLPDVLFQWLMVVMGVTTSMSSFKGRVKEQNRDLHQR